MPRGDQLIRQWKLLQLIDRPAGITVDDAVGELACHRRTIFRDLQVLQAAGFPIYNEDADDGRRRVWRVTEAFRRQIPLRLTLAELAALLMSRELLAPLGASVLGPAMRSAYAKVSGVLSRDALALIEAMRDTIGVRAFGAKLQQPSSDYIPAIQAALVDRRRLRVRYYSASRDAETDRDVDPYHLTYFNGGLYLVAYCHERKAVRIFAVERFRRVQPLAATFEVPAGFDLESYLNNAWGIIRGDLVTVKVVFARALARYIAERLWHPSQQLRTLPDGRLEMTLRVADTHEVRRFILGYGVDAEVIEPASMREALRAQAQALAERLAPGRRPLAALPAESSRATPAAPARARRFPPARRAPTR
jgi:predicted DNA-binding transcriptional regulator YafY